MQSVWIVDHGSWDTLGVVSAHHDPESAAAHLRQLFGPPYRVRWEPLQFSPGGDEAVLLGEFSAVPGFSPDQTAYFVMQRWAVDDDIHL